MDPGPTVFQSDFWFVSAMGFLETVLPVAVVPAPVQSTETSWAVGVEV